MMDMMVPSSPKSNHSKKFVPRVGELAMNEGQPTRIRHTKGGILPNITMNKVGGDEEGKENHEDGVGCGAIEGIEQFGVDESVVGFVAYLVEFGVNFVFSVVHKSLERVNAHQLGEHQSNIDSSFPRVIGGGEETKHPGNGEVRSQEEESFRATKVTNHVVEEVFLGVDILLLDRNGVRVEYSKVMINHHEDLADHDSEETHEEANRTGVIKTTKEVRETSCFGGLAYFHNVVERKEKEKRWTERDK